ncbi:MAG: hypothetical protein C4337_00050 [Armatimonadota bacterium]
MPPFLTLGDGEPKAFQNIPKGANAPFRGTLEVLLGRYIVERNQVHQTRHPLQLARQQLRMFGGVVDPLQKQVLEIDFLTQG